jgi:hypothetical protein
VKTPKLPRWLFRKTGFFPPANSFKYDYEKPKIAGMKPLFRMFLTCLFYRADTVLEAIDPQHPHSVPALLLKFKDIVRMRIRFVNFF